MKETFYFTHDYNARSDDKIKSLIRKHGMLGYGLFWSIIEDLYNNANALRLDYEGIAYDLHSDKNIIKSILNDFDLFQIKDGIFYSLSVKKRLEERISKSKKASESAYLRWNKYANALPTQSDSNAIKEKKRKEKKEIKEKDFIPPSLEEVKKFFKEKGYKESVAIIAYEGYNYANWHDSTGKQVKNWKQKMNNVWFKEENKIISQPVLKMENIIQTPSSKKLN